jgi:small subunit ribosomal protein S17
MTEQNSVDVNKSQRIVVGTVISDKMNKTIVVQVERKVKHPLYGKYVRRFSKMYAHDEDNACKIGDLVVIQQSRPLSKTKRWKLVEILKREEQQ